MTKLLGRLMGPFYVKSYPIPKIAQTTKSIPRFYSSRADSGSAEGTAEARLRGFSLEVGDE